MGRLGANAHHGVLHASHLEPAQVADIIALTHAAGDADGAHPLSEHVMLHLRHGGDTPATHLLAYVDDESVASLPATRSSSREDLRHSQLVGYAHVDPTDVVEGPSAELFVHPLYRRRGLGRALVLAAIEAADRTDSSGRLRLWAHGDHPSANALALSLGFDRSRMLWQMRRSLYAPVPAPQLPPETTVRTFRPGLDDAGWLDLNNRAFAGHPDQSGWTASDLQARLAEDWFDPNGFLLAEHGGKLVGFHWTKVHGTVHPPEHAHDHKHSHDHDHGHDHDPIGEVYVLGVDPAAHGHGLGAALTLAGLRYLRSRGLDQVMLYVDESNPTAIALYERLGFARWSTDVCFRRPGTAADPG